MTLPASAGISSPQEVKFLGAYGIGDIEAAMLLLPHGEEGVDTGMMTPRRQQ